MAVMVGMTGEVEHVVSDADTAVALGSGTIDVLGTPRVLAWCEEATMRAVAPGVREDDVCVGTRASLEHVKPVGVGSTVVARAEVTAVDGRLITLEVEMCERGPDGEELLAHGEVVRVILDRAKFLARLG